MEKVRQSIATVKALRVLYILAFIAMFVVSIIFTMGGAFHVLYLIAEGVSFVITLVLFSALISALTQTLALATSLTHKDVVTVSEINEASDRINRVNIPADQKVYECHKCGGEVYSNETTCYTCGAKVKIPKSHTN